MRLSAGLALFVGAILGFAAPATAQTVALTGARLIDGTGAAPVERSVLVIRDGKVAAVGAEGAVAIPAGAERIDLEGKTIIPGLISAHAHVPIDAKSALSGREQIEAQLGLYARYGVTTVYSLGDDGVESVKMSDAPLGDAPARARLHVSGPVVGAASASEGHANVAAHAAMGVDIIKIRIEGADSPVRKPEVHKALIDEAHSRGLRVAAHIFPLADAKALVDAEVDIIAHSVRDRDVDAELIAAMKAGGVGYIPTLTRDLSIFIYGSTPDFMADPFLTREPSFREAAARLMEPAAQAKVRADPAAQAIKPALAQAMRNLKLLSDAGVPIAMGTDSGAGQGRWQGYFEHVELAMMVEAGMSPMQALVSATGDAAKVMRLGDVGTLEPGKAADLLVLGANPIDDIRNTRTIEAVWIAGHRLDN